MKVPISGFTFKNLLRHFACLNNVNRREIKKQTADAKIIGGLLRDCVCRGGKFTTFEGGVRVPGFVLDFSRRYAARRTATNHILHISDWLPTFLAWAGRTDLLQGGGLSDPLSMFSYFGHVHHFIYIDIFFLLHLIRNKTGSGSAY